MYQAVRYAKRAGGVILPSRSVPENGDLKFRDARPSVIITTPPWPRSGTGRVIESQIEFYRDRGYQTVLIAVPFRSGYGRESAIWGDISEGILKFGADHTFLATIERRELTFAKYAATMRHGHRGTALDWLMAAGGVGKLTPESLKFLRSVKVALLHVNHVFTFKFALRLRRRLLSDGSRIPIILETHDVQSHMLYERREPNPWFRRPDRVECLLKSEVAQLRIPNVLIHLSSNDFAFFQREVPLQSHFLVFPTIAEEFISLVKEKPPLTEAIDILFVADWHPPNLSAIQWYSEQVWPLLAEYKYIFRVIGRLGKLVEGKAPQLYEASRDWFVGEVGDLAPFYRSARCVIAPMVSGSGISIKTIEAFALGKAFVGTSKAFRGMPIERLRSLGIHPFDEPEAFANAIVTTLNHPEAAEHASRMAYKELFSKEASFSVRAQALVTALKQVPSAAR